MFFSGSRYKNIDCYFQCPGLKVKSKELILKQFEFCMYTLWIYLAVVNLPVLKIYII